MVPTTAQGAPEKDPGGKGGEGRNELPETDLGLSQRELSHQ